MFSEHIIHIPFGMAERRVLVVNWKSIDGAAQGKRKLQLRNNDEGTFTCPVKLCLHANFKSHRGLRKHIDNKHPWYYYFEEQPSVKREDIENSQPPSRRASTFKFPSYSIEEGRGKDFLQWLETTCGGGKSNRDAKQTSKRAMKFLVEFTGDNYDHLPLSNELIDCCLGSPQIFIRFLAILEKEWKLSYSASLTYVKSISDLLDFRKSEGVTDCNLRCFTVTEVYLRRAKDNLRKKKNLECTRNFDLETLIARDSWATLEEMQKVIPFHMNKFEQLTEKCMNQSPLPTKNELMFCTRFIVTLLFLKVKCNRPMTFQYLTIEMITKAKTNGGFIDQTQFKTAEKYLFDTLIITEEVMTILNTYITYTRPLLNPTTTYLLTSSTGGQYQSLTTAMTMLVHQAIGKHINPTRYRQIVETASSEILSREEQECVSQDQKHSSTVAKIYYKKKQSRQVALEGKRCMDKMISASLTAPSLSFKRFPNNQQTIVNEVDQQISEAPVNPFESIELPSHNDAMTPEARILDTVRDILTTPLSSSGPQITVNRNDDVIVTKTINKINVPSCSSYDKNTISKSLKIKKERASVEVQKSAFRNVKFTSEEDDYLKMGIQKYGRKNWSSILRDTEFKFQECRNRDSLRMRAESVAFKKILTLP